MFDQLKTGIWLKKPYEIVPNQKGGKNLMFYGFEYRKEASFKTSINWVCNRNSVGRCRARLIQNTVTTEIKLGQHGHNHPPRSIRTTN